MAKVGSFLAGQGNGLSLLFAMLAVMFVTLILAQLVSRFPASTQNIIISIVLGQSMVLRKNVFAFNNS